MQFHTQDINLVTDSSQRNSLSPWAFKMVLVFKNDQLYLKITFIEVLEPLIPPNSVLTPENKMHLTRRATTAGHRGYLARFAFVYAFLA